MMKKWLIALLLCLLMMAAASSALAAEAIDMTAECKFTLCSSKRKYDNMVDKLYTSYWESNKIKNPWVAVKAEGEKLIGGLYVCFGEMPGSWEVQVSDDGKDWFKAIDGDPRFLHAYVQLPEAAKHVRLIANDGEKFQMRINEFYVLSEGDTPSWVQVWQPTHEKADLMFISTHPDDELIFYGGAIPTYAAERGVRVVVAYFTASNTTRSSELLNGLWHMGVRHYPVMGDFRDTKATSLSDAYKKVGGKAKVNEWFVALYRQYKPEVVVVQDEKGEYGHTQHKMVSEAALYALDPAKDEDQYTDLTVQYGPWEVKKFYRHLWKENQITFDWDVPLQSMNGSTGLELAAEAFELYHKTQHGSGYNVLDTGKEYDNTLFGLVRSTVGEDVEKNDFLENIEVGAPAVIATPAPTEATRWAALMPEMNDRGFLDEGEFVYSSEEEGLWIFVDETSKVIIERKYDPTQPLTWFEANLYTDVEAGEVIRTIWNDDERKTRERADAAETAKKHGVVFAMNTDYFTYRIASDSNYHKGVVIRDGEILHDDPNNEKKANDGRFPNLDMLAFYPDGALKVYRSYEITAKEMVNQGAYAVYSFGPALMKDGKLTQQAYDAGDSKNPRCALGMVEPGHYVAIMAEGRLERSGGISISYLAKLMRAAGCQNAFNLDGGQTAVMVFMGKQIMQIGSYDGGKTNSRPTCEVLAVGFSEQVGTYEVK